MAEIPGKILKTLICNLCGEYLSHPPITLYAETGSVCGRCPELEAENNIQPLHEKEYEMVASLFTFPCRYNLNGCTEMHKMVDIPKHELVCKYKPFFCPVLPLGDCSWQGSALELYHHFSTVHTSLLLESHLFELDFVNRYKECWLLPFEENMFLVYCDKEDDDKLMVTVRAVGYSEMIDRFNYQLTFSTAIGSVPLEFPEEQVLMDYDLNYVRSTVDLNILMSSLQEPSSITCNIRIIERHGGEVVFIPQEKKKINVEVNKMLIDLECPVCQEFMVPPIYQCVTGHSVCGTCKPSLNACPSCRSAMGNTRNFTLEKLTENIEYSCHNRYEGCTYISQSSKIKEHEAICKFNPYDCPVGNICRCTWKGKYQNVLQHVYDSHNEYIQREDLQIDLKVDEFYESVRVISYKSEIFIIRYRYDDTEQFYTSIFHLGGSDEGEFLYDVAVVDLTSSGLELRSKKFCGALTDDLINYKHCTAWSFDMLVPLMVSGQLKLKYKIINANRH